ncbi:calcium-binding mitochondrial carrier protein SCaMC-1-like [Zeugodacus cucurbitae]|uniref:calcium-binding mitochondrial carrier protein SCaMC-1-like n=1 Tax=Zeugodacus cucurbitae TaxID=28588 RepID=UPI0010A73F51|nr:calcium-binding mitochondrial carrier protein SCaMC-1-like [Zeugodacus cucurbitae]
MDVTTTFRVKQASLKSSPLWTHLIAGGVAGAISRTCTAPADRIKIYLQVQTKKTSFMESVRHLIRDGGVLSMWRGNGINVLKITPESAIKFAVYDESKRFLRGDESRSLTMGERFVCGALAGNVSQTFLYPMDVLKTRLALVKTGQYSGVIHMIKHMFEQEGIRSFYRGYNAFAVGIMLYCGIDLAVYETAKHAYLGYKEAENTLKPLVILSCCTLSSTIGQLSTYPLALLSSRLQAKTVFRDEVPSKNFIDKNMVLLLWRIRQKEGITAWYRGLLPNFMKSVPCVCITYIVYEYMISLLGYSMI